ncbi:ComEC/Rec2 family competence protein [Pseudarthrobacter sp. L1SW]|nr:ComEC/Rec2 family competence protein [Pseudarthrobacter sp. L1SW]
MGSGRKSSVTSPWSRYVESAVRGPSTPSGPGGSPEAGAGFQEAPDIPAVRSENVPGRRRTLALASPSGHRVLGRWSLIREAAWQRAVKDGQGTTTGTSGEAPRRRTDIRLTLPAAAVWAASIAGLWLTPLPLGILCCAAVVLGLLLLSRAARASLAGFRRRRPGETVAGEARPAGRRAAGAGVWGRRAAGAGGTPVQRSFLATSAAALFLAAAAASHSAVAATQRSEGPLAEAIAAGKSVVAVVEVAGTPRALSAPGQAGPPERWSVPVWTQEISTGGAILRTRAQVVVMGGQAWANLVPGQLVRTAGKFRPPDPGRNEAGILTASSAPGRPNAPPLLQGSAKILRERFVAAASFLAPDPAGLLPGMVTGDTSKLDEGLDNAMRSVGMTHLTAVSGANCSLVLGALLLACRSLRLPRVPAAVLAGAGLGLFVVLVGPDASVLRAALMGAVGVISLAGGRSGRGLSFLCLAVIGLLLIDPGLGSSFGFLLSVLATLGIIVLGRRVIDWTPAVIPRWVAAAAAVPLSAQLMCGPVLVMLQPQFSTYSLLANVIASPLVAPVTLLGTAAVPLVIPAPWAATALIAVAGTFSAGVAATARFTAQLPGASLPWPEGIAGLSTMLLLSVLTFGTVWVACRPRRLGHLILALHRQTVALIEVLETRQAGTLRRIGCRSVPEPGRPRVPLSEASLERTAGRGRLEYSTRLSGRNPRWPLRRSEQPVPRQRIQPPGGM